MDKDNIHIDSEFIDHSWQEMSKLLDREMPVKKRRKRLLWVWFLGLGLFLLGSLAYINQLQVKEVKALPIPEKPIIASTNTPISPSTTKRNSSNIVSKKGPKKQTPRKSSDDRQAFQSIINLTETIPTAVNKNAAEGTSVHENSDKNASTLNPASNLSGIITKNLDSKQLHNKILVADLAILPILPFSQLSTETEETTIPLFPSKGYPKWRLGVYAGMLIPTSGSFRTGLQANVSFNPKWRLYLGLGYAKRIPKITNSTNSNADLTAEPILEADMEDMNTTAGTGPAPSNTDPDGTGSNGVEAIAATGFQYSNFHYFEVPILIQYTIRPKFSIELGGSLSYLYGYNYQYNEDSFFTNNSTFDTFTTTRSTTFNQADIGTINKLGIAFIGGVNYQITHNINGYANFHYSSPYIKGTPTSSFTSKNWQQIEVGIRYYFK